MNYSRLNIFSWSLPHIEVGLHTNSRKNWCNTISRKIKSRRTLKSSILARLPTDVRLHNPSENTVFGRKFYAHRTKTSNNLAKLAKKGEFPSKFRDFPDFGHGYPIVSFYELLNISTDIDCPADIVSQSGEGEFCADLFFPLQRK